MGKPQANKPQCPHYNARNPKEKEGCSNCTKGIGIQCAEHLTLMKEYETARKMKALDMMMRSNRGVRIE